MVLIWSLKVERYPYSKIQSSHLKANKWATYRTTGITSQAGCPRTTDSINSDENMDLTEKTSNLEPCEETVEHPCSDNQNPLRMNCKETSLLQRLCDLSTWMANLDCIWTFALNIWTFAPKESVMLCIGTLTPEHWACVVCFVSYFVISFSFSYWEGCDMLRDMWSFLAL